MGLIYTLAATLIIGLISGGTIGFKFEEAQALKYKNALELANIISAETLSKAKAELSIANVSAINLNKDLENANFQHIQTINAYSDKLHDAIAKRLHDSTARCSNTLPKANSTSKSVENARGSGLPKDYVGFLEQQLKLADETAVYAQTCFKFVNANCGIK